MILNDFKTKKKFYSFLSIFILNFLLLNGQFIYSHGEDKLGPNGGFIQMPGAFHTELVPGEKGSFKFYLLDMKWENPSVSNSSLEVYLYQSKKKNRVPCQAEGTFFLCKLEKGMSLKNGAIEVKAQREGVMGQLATYKLPLGLPKSKVNQSHGHN